MSQLTMIKAEWNDFGDRRLPVVNFEADVALQPSGWHAR
jgi:hypothetical protein